MAPVRNSSGWSPCRTSLESRCFLVEKAGFGSLGFQGLKMIRGDETISDWWFFPTPRKNMRQLGWLYPIYGKQWKTKTVPNHTSIIRHGRRHDRTKVISSSKLGNQYSHKLGHGMLCLRWSLAYSKVPYVGLLSQGASQVTRKHWDGPHRASTRRSSCCLATRCTWVTFMRIHRNALFRMGINREFPIGIRNILVLVSSITLILDADAIIVPHVEFPLLFHPLIDSHKDSEP